VRAVITAGGRIDGAYAAAAETTVKALARVRGRTMLARAIEAARGAGAVEVAVVGGDAVREACADTVDRVVADSPSGAQNVARALGAWPDDDALLYLTSDLPYVNAVAVREFVVRACGSLAMPICSREAFARRFPEATGFGIRIGSEHIVNGGAFHLPAGSTSRVATLAAALFEARKRPLRMARVAGADLFLRFALGILNVAALERRAERVVGVPVQAVRDCAPELAYDADGVAEYRYACERD
jgi:GTP:adenosylcobinamide-phosphate guanylyltransferase